MAIQNQTYSQKNTAYPVTDNFVKIGKVAYPITHSFVIRESCENQNVPVILECYNTLPPFIGPLSFKMSNFSGANESASSLTFAHAGEITGSAASGFITGEVFGESTHLSMFIIGRMPPVMPDQSYSPGAFMYSTFRAVAEEKPHCHGRSDSAMKQTSSAICAGIMLPHFTQGVPWVFIRNPTRTGGQRGGQI